jgi:hypothetical protein
MNLRRGQLYLECGSIDDIPALAVPIVRVRVVRDADPFERRRPVAHGRQEVSAGHVSVVTESH